MAQMNYNLVIIRIIRGKNAIFTHKQSEVDFG